MPAKKLFRSKVDRKIAGVCGGLGEYFKIDSVFVRIVFVLLIFAEGIGLILYFLGWILIPENPHQKFPEMNKKNKPKEKERGKKAVSSETKAEKIVQKKGSGSILIGIVLILLGAAFLFQNIFKWFRFELIWPFALIALGLYMIFEKGK